MRLSTKAKSKKTSPVLAKGQLWKTKDLHIQITDLGNRLVHYKMLRTLGQMKRAQMTAHGTLEDYLRANDAQLVKDGSE
jgi:hypothetical protein